MKVTIHAEGSAKEIAQQLTEAAAVYGGGSAPAASAPVKTGKPGRPAKPKDEEEEEFDLTDAEEEQEEEENENEEESEEETEEEEESGESESEEEEAPSVSLQDVIGAFQKYAKKNSREDAAKVLKKFKVKSVKDLKKDQYPAVLKALK